LESNNAHEVTEDTRDSPNWNVFCTLSKQNVFGLFPFAARTVIGILNLDNFGGIPHAHFGRTGC
jgi:hypothetical protein